jgi:hypothetical protein
MRFFSGIIASSMVVAVAGFLHAQEVRMTPADYIMTYKEAAQTEMRLYKIPASITLAQGILESNSGNSALARKANNHFGIKCKPEWKGATMLQDDDAKGECFRKYNTVWESYRDHSLFLSTRSYYTDLFKLEITDYKGWAYGLKTAGYATEPRYAELLIGIIEDYKLYEYDKEVVNGQLVQVVDTASVEYVHIKDTVRDNITLIPDSAVLQQTDFSDIEFAENGKQIYRMNGVRYVLAWVGETYASIAADFNLSEKELLLFNDYKKSHKPVSGEIVFIETKMDRGPVEFHIVADGETMQSISQQYGMKLRELYRKNLMKQGTEPTSGQRLYLQQSAPVY